MIRAYLHNMAIAWEAMLQNKLRAVLTSLGIIFGVGSVIAMLAIGAGAEQEILEKMKLLGTNTIIIKAVELDKNKVEYDEDGEEIKTQKRFSPGLTVKDAEAVYEFVPYVKSVSPEVVIDVIALREGFKRNVKLVGINNHYFHTNNIAIARGSIFHKKNIEYSEPVCIIGWGIAAKLFPADDPIGKMIKCGNHWLKIIGTTSEKYMSKDNIQSLGIRDYNMDIYVPISTILLRYKNRSLITAAQLIRTRSTDEEPEAPESPHQLDRIVIEADDSKYIPQIAEIIGRLINRRHNKVIDYEIIIPEQLLEQEQSAKRIFNIVLGAIASISLIVGGIGIMNIMLASVLERTKEIGVRRAVGAKQRDIMMQFLSEAVAISITGGFLGIILGVSVSYGIERLTEISTIISVGSVALSFLVSISVGLVFGIAPAKKASRQDTIELLRYE